MGRRLLSFFLCIIIVLSLLPTAFSGAVSAYDPQVALQFASEHWNDGKGLCAEFVSRCLNAGGCDSFNRSCTALVGILRKRTDCTEYTIYMNEDRSVSMSNYLDKLAPGDPLFYHCSFQNNYQHAILCNGMDANGLLRAYAHNLANDGSRAIYYGLFCPECGCASIDYLTAFHFDTTPPEITAWFSEKKQGNETENFLTGSPYYLCYCLKDKNSGKLLDNFRIEDYRITAEVKYPDGSLLCSHTYQNDSNWLPVYFSSPGTYSYRVSVSGKNFSDEIIGEVSVERNPITLTAKKNEISFVNANSPSETIEFAVNGFAAEQLTLIIRENDPVDAFSAVTESFSSGKAVISVSPLAVGSGSFEAELLGASSGEVLASAAVSVSVAGKKAAVSYHANGGTGAPEQQVVYCGESIYLSTEIPTGNAYTVYFEPNGGQCSEALRQVSQVFSSWNTEKDGSGKNYEWGEYCRIDAPLALYAQYEKCILGEGPIPEKEGCSFIGWFDSPESDSYGAPVGNRYAPDSVISNDLTLYAMWSAASVRRLGDLNDDGIISETDVSELRDFLSGDTVLRNTEMYFADLDADGDIDSADGVLLENLSRGVISEDDIPAAAMQKDISVYGCPKAFYAYGETFDYNNTALLISYSDKVSYVVSEALEVNGYDSHTVGEQTVIVSAGGCSAELTVSVLPPRFFLNFDPNGGKTETRQINIIYGNAVGALPVPVRQGYTFLGWSVDPPDYIDENTIYFYPENRTAVACWREGCGNYGHDYQPIITAPCCAEDGCTVYRCTICGTEYTDRITDKTEHNFSEGFCTLCGAADPEYIPGICDGGEHCPGDGLTDYPKPAEWSHEGVDFCLKNGLFLGTSETTFSPNAEMTRAMLVTVLYRMEGESAASEILFDDVPESEWYYDAVTWAAGQSIVNGEENNMFCPNESISREQLATILFRYAVYKGYETECAQSLQQYPDEASVSEWAYDSLAWAVSMDLVNGIGKDGTSYLEPQSSATRAQVAVILMRYIRAFDTDL